ncbi:putative SARP-family transcriptional activator [Actinoplanes missouriensis 431]|uniref:Putative SARP-family transcriptional activator n=1 Tax=Actinoplanes missouriensis (strain ATCC 14538 / DSM 43046 / CBS 188.64 / JCM 3121 / NBRC 102363 / NCIMB 12654 / NRRL B-3342 / UNCC 431) TaxID=512565 RepID=I0H9Q3_ACTM4|nr:BTAD domain-containing putative transcriptional regulator [Actinoplanes missouriensis]BAL89740.1 putative SARP-family transcriptional activator [Actinoplanes missouriensis 431]
MSIEVRLLGPVELRGEDGPVDPGPAKRRATLAVLALEVNRPVTLNRLTDLLWGDEPPASAVANIRNHVAALRRTLGDRIVSRQGSYQMNLAAHELDVTEFHRLAELGRAALAGGDASRAEPALDAALRLWRGAAGHGLPRGAGLDVLLAGLEADRLRVLEDLTEARLDLGYAGELVPVLRDHLGAHPLRERAWAQLMLALYRAGDLAAALSAYRQAQATLQAQLGVDPGSELVDLHVAMLERAPRLDPWARQLLRRNRPAIGEVPRELPPDPVFLTGHAGEIAAVLAAARPAAGERTPAAVVVHGPPGSGKSALVTRAGHRLADTFPDGQIFAVAGAGVTAADLLGRALRALGVPPGEVPEQADERIGRYRSLLAARRVLIVVDGATSDDQVRPLIPAASGSALLVTSREPMLVGEGVPHVALPAPDRITQGRCSGRTQ